MNYMYDMKYKSIFRHFKITSVESLNNTRYTQNGILHMLDRNRRIKPMPERFQACKEKFNVIITCEERVYDQVIEGKKT